MSSDPDAAVLVHATALVLDDVGLLIRGPSGAGKSRLALALLEAAGCTATTRPGEEGQGSSALISDDYVRLSGDGQLIASPAPNLAGCIEMRGLGIVGLPWRDEAPINLVVDLEPLEAMERLPETRQVVLEGHTLPHVSVPLGDLAHQMLLVRTALALLAR